jgi:Transcriptional regulatory protein, C terminal
MMKPKTIADLLAHGSAESLIGRTRELALLSELLAPGGPAVAYVHGPYGIGKSALLAAFQTPLSLRGIDSVRIDGGTVEPQPEAVIAALASTLGAECRTLPELVSILAGDRRTVIVIDNIDALRLVAGWLRRDLVPALPAATRLAVAGRLPPPMAWMTDLGAMFMSIPLVPIQHDVAVDALRGAGLDGDAANRVWEVSRGHPLSLRMALQAARAGALETVDSLGDLCEAIVAGASEPSLRQMVRAAAVVRRVTRPLLAAMLGDDALEGFDAFAALPFVALDREGHYLAEPVRRLQSTRLLAVEPRIHAGLRAAAVKWITGQLATAQPAERWRSMADLLYLVEHSQVRDAFFPADALLPPVEAATLADLTEVLDISEARVGSEERQIIQRWVETLPHRFSVARGARGKVLAFYVCASSEDGLAELAHADPLLACWCADVAARRPSGRVLFVRQLLARDLDDAAPERAACMLDLKRHYFEHWSLARVYTAASAAKIADPLTRRLGFRPLTPPRDRLPGSMVLDLPGAGLVGWIAALVGGSTPERAAPAGLAFAHDRREVEIDGACVRLTRLEANVLAILIDRAPAVVSRENLIDAVWRREFVGSNVVDAVVRTLRRKLGRESQRIETVPKAGYRYVNAVPTAS